MRQEDYIMRMIRQSTKLTARLLDFQYPEEPFYILEVIELACTTALNIDPKLLEEWTEEEFRQWMQDTTLHPAQVRLLVEILDKKAGIAAQAGDDQKCRRFGQRTIVALEYLNDVEQVFSMERQARIFRLRERLGEQANHKKD